MFGGGHSWCCCPRPRGRFPVECGISLARFPLYHTARFCTPWSRLTPMTDTDIGRNIASVCCNPLGVQFRCCTMVFLTVFVEVYTNTCSFIFLQLIGSTNLYNLADRFLNIWAILTTSSSGPCKLNIYCYKNQIIWKHDTFKNKIQLLLVSPNNWGQLGCKWLTRPAIFSPTSNIAQDKTGRKIAYQTARSSIVPFSIFYYIRLPIKAQGGTFFNHLPASSGTCVSNNLLLIVSFAQLSVPWLIGDTMADAVELQGMSSLRFRYMPSTLEYTRKYLVAQWRRSYHQKKEIQYALVKNWLSPNQ